MEIKQAQIKVDTKIKEYGGYWESLSMMARLTEEVGELARAMNQKYGGKKKKHSNDGREIAQELADVFYTILAISNKEKIDLDTEFNLKTDKSHNIYKEVYKNGN